MKTIGALEDAIQALLIVHQKSDLPGDVYLDLSIDIAGFRHDRSNPVMLQTMIDNTVALLDQLDTLGLSNTRTYDVTLRAVDATRNEMRQPAVTRMADALIAAIRAADPSAMADDMVVNGVRTFAFDAMIDAESVARMLLDAAERIAKQ